MKIDKYLYWEKPEIQIFKDPFIFYINKDNIEIECEGWDGHLRRAEIPTQELAQLLKEIEETNQ